MLEIGNEVARQGLHGASPNPFRARTEILFAQARAGQVEIAIHDLAGRRMRLLARDAYGAGSHRVGWDGRSDAGERLPAGLYFVRIDIAGERFNGKVVLAE